MVALEFDATVPDGPTGGESTFQRRREVAEVNHVVLEPLHERRRLVVPAAFHTNRQRQLRPREVLVETEVVGQTEVVGHRLA